MSKKPADILGDQIFLDIEMDQTIPIVAQLTIIKVAVESEERWFVQLMQKRDYLVVFHSASPNVAADLLKREAPAPQQNPLTLGDVLVQ